MMCHHTIALDLEAAGCKLRYLGDCIKGLTTVFDQKAKTCFGEAHAAQAANGPGFKRTMKGMIQHYCAWGRFWAKPSQVTVAGQNQWCKT
jgi:hypothetical protein